MANVNNPNGFLYSSINAELPPLMRLYEKISSATLAIFQQDIVYEPTGVSGHDAAPIKSFGDGATPGATQILGVAINYGAALTATKHTVIVDPVAEYHAQDNNATDGIASADMGKNANVDPTGVAGSVTTAWSGMQINETGINTTNSLDLHLLRRWPDPNNAFGSNCRVLVKINTPRETTLQVGV